ncbi:Peptidase family C25 [Rubripirellula tenax]|uniref:Peptidase family C25 n=1 Tax=Rubripirellula tenax TaxID=2528015 RepID=A0A5C6FIX4_9BACT|nr:C25 family cysteine peptidase [Rubripirellula tenax]TWU60755.1 Peptidase family C25 [Rubripirellula tenax]
MTTSRILFGLAHLILFQTWMLGSARAVDTIVVCAESFQPDLQPWLEHRRGEGMTISVVASSSDVHQVRRSIREAADDSTRYVVLVGDAPVIGSPCDPAKCIPINYWPTTVTAKWGSTPTLSSDLSYGDFDDDGVPEAVVGRMPVDTPVELQQAIKRIIAYEASDDFGDWRNEVQLVCGMGGFGMMADAAIESVTRSVITGVLPMATRTNVAYASEGHPFCPVRQPFTESVLANYRSGARFWVYAGHGQVTELDRFPQTEDGIPVLDPTSAARLDCRAAASPIAVLLACYTGAMDAPDDSIAESMWLAKGGPIAVIAGSRVTMPYGNTTAAMGLIDGVFDQRLPRLGDAWLSTLGDMHRETEPDPANSRMMIDALATMISPAGTVLSDERREHMLLYNLIGDPTLTMHHPQTIKLNVPASHQAGDNVVVGWSSPVSGEVKIRIDRPLGAATKGDANDTTVASIQTQALAGKQMIMAFKLPLDTIGPLIVRVSVAGEYSWAAGATQTIMRAP